MIAVLVARYRAEYLIDEEPGVYQELEREADRRMKATGRILQESEIR